MSSSFFLRCLLLLTGLMLWQTLSGQEQATTAHLLILRKQADLSDVPIQAPKEVKGTYVFRRLQQTASQTQADLLQWLGQEGISNTPLWIVNAIYAQGLTPSHLQQLRQHPQIDRILVDTPIRLSEPFSADPSPLRSQSDIEWNVLQIQADKVWNMGITGEGVTIGGQDTGIDWLHPALQQQYRGVSAGDVDHNYHWFDAIREIDPYWADNPENPCGLQVVAPCDDHIHGTHTMGTMVGDDGAGNRIGVAPGARWIGARNMDRGLGSPTTYLRCFEWFLAPTALDGRTPRPDLAPDVINNSWYCPEAEGCHPGFHPVFAQAIQNLRTAGIFVVVSAGNFGMECQTINAIPASIDPAFAVGATDASDSIARFSARGPAFSFDETRLFKPDVSAPGVRVRSAGLDSTYRTFSGTSMAAPHVAGTVALMISANPHLRGQVDSIAAILRRTALPLQSSGDCGSFALPAGYDPAYGYGRIDALAAVQAALADTTGQPPRPAEDESVPFYPNPVGQEVHFILPERIQTGYIRIFDSLGRPVLEQELAWNLPVQTLFLGRQPAGTYFYEIRWNRERRTGRFIKQ